MHAPHTHTLKPSTLTTIATTATEGEAVSVDLTAARERSKRRLHAGVTATDSAAPAYPAAIEARIVKRAPDRIRLQLRAQDFAELAPEVGAVLVIELEEPDLLEVVAAEVYQVHARHELVDCRLRSPLATTTTSVQIRRTSLGGKL